MTKSFKCNKDDNKKMDVDSKYAVAKYRLGIKHEESFVADIGLGEYDRSDKTFEEEYPDLFLYGKMFKKDGSKQFACRLKLGHPILETILQLREIADTLEELSK